MAKIRMEFEKGGVIEGTLFEDQAPKTCKAFLEALPHEHVIGHAMWAGEEIFFDGFPGKFEYEHPTQKVDPGDLAMVPQSSAFCVFYGRSMPRKAVDEGIDVTVFGKVDDIPGMAEISRRVRTQGWEKVRLTKV
jgi:hypothetical protein